MILANFQAEKQFNFFVWFINQPHLQIYSSMAIVYQISYLSCTHPSPRQFDF